MIDNEWPLLRTRCYAWDVCTPESVQDAIVKNWLL